MLPKVSLPIAKPTSPAATADAEPADEPLEPSPGFRGFVSCRRTIRRPSPVRPTKAGISTAPAFEPLCDRGLDVESLILEDLGAPGGLVSRDGDQILGAPGNTVQRTAITTRCELSIGASAWRMASCCRRDHAVEG